MKTRIRKKIILFFAVIFILLFAFSIYLFKFNSGLSFERLNNNNIEIKNTSMHLIREIKIYLNDELIAEINELKPTEEKEIDLNNVKGTVKLRAEALFHVPVEFVFNASPISQLNLSYGINVIDPLPVGLDTNIELELCNQGEKIKELKITVKADEEYLSLKNNSKVETLEKNECKEVNFDVNALKKGKITIKFELIAGQEEKQFNRILSITG